MVISMFTINGQIRVMFETDADRYVRLALEAQAKSDQAPTAGVRDAWLKLAVEWAVLARGRGADVTIGSRSNSPPGDEQVGAAR